MAMFGATGGASAAPTKGRKCCAGFCRKQSRAGVHRAAITKSRKRRAEFKIGKAFNKAKALVKIAVFSNLIQVYKGRRSVCSAGMPVIL